MPRWPLRAPFPFAQCKHKSVENYFSVKRDKRFISKNFVHFVFAIALLLPTRALATYYAVAFSKDFLVVAIDSRATDLFNPSAPPNDRYCKIHPFSDDVAFFATGYVATNTLGVSFDASTFAKEVYDRAQRPLNLADLADKWDDYMQDAFARLFIANPLLAITLGKKTMIKGYFGGISDDTKVVLESSEIISDYGAIKSRLLHQSQAGDSIPIVHGGHNEIIGEFMNGGNTDRAKKVLAEIETAKADKSAPEKMAITVEAFVKSVRDWSGDAGIGGDVAVLILERGKALRWFHRPDFCPEN